MRIAPVVLTLALTLGVGACSPHVRVAPEVTVAEPARAPTAAAASPPSEALSSTESFVLRTASSRYDFRFDMKGACADDGIHTSACAGPAVLHVSTKEGVELQKLDLENVWIPLDDAGDPVVNAADLYDTQGAIIVGDFDFDGREDFAVQVDQSGPYGGPTFAVFVHAAHDEAFVLSEPLSELTQESLGFFRVDAAKKRLVTSRKGSCCYHVTEWHEVVRGEPRVVERITEDATIDDAFVVQTEERLIGGRWQKTVRHVPRVP
jgi:hypothetical protein